MAIAPRCDVVECGAELTEFGAIVLSPPDDTGRVEKRHVCQWCYALFFVPRFKEPSCPIK